MLKYPMQFKVEAHTSSGIQKNWTTKSESVSTELQCSIPPEFEGPGGGYSPEDLYAFALANCFIATFKVFAEKSRLEYDDLKAQLTLEVDRDEKGFPWMARAHLKATIKNPNFAEKAQSLLEKTSKSCMILNSVKTEKSFEFEII